MLLINFRADPNVDSAVADASSAVEGTTTAGEQVVSDCK